MERERERGESMCVCVCLCVQVVRASVGDIVSFHTLLLCLYSPVCVYLEVLCMSVVCMLLILCHCVLGFSHESRCR